MKATITITGKNDEMNVSVKFSKPVVLRDLDQYSEADQRTILATMKAAEFIADLVGETESTTIRKRTK